MRIKFQIIFQGKALPQAPLADGRGSLRPRRNSKGKWSELDLDCGKSKSHSILFVIALDTNI